MKISIITINYNNEVGLKRTLESVVQQSYKDFEFIVIDGGSTDSSVSLIKQYEGSINTWISEKDNGIYNALNKGIQRATGDYLLFLNSGDHFFSNTVLEKNYSELDGTDLVCFDIHVLGQGFDQINTHPDTINFSYLFEETFAHQSVFIKRSLFDIVGLYDESLKIVSDWKFFIHALATYHCSYKCVHNTLSVYYFDGISPTAQGTFIRRDERIKVLKEEFSIFYNDYKEMEKLKTNRFKMLEVIEKTKIGQKLISFIFRTYIVFFSKKRLKDIIK